VATLRGEVVGLLSDYGGELRSVVPLDSLGSVIDRLFAERQVHRATLGISYVQSTWLSTFVTSGVPDDGALITALKAPAKAGQAGLMVGDRVVKAAGELVAERSLSSLLQQYRPGARIDLTVERAGKEVRVDVTLGEQVSKPTPSTKP
jgi:S1-C subfamily serine protease